MTAYVVDGRCGAQTLADVFAMAAERREKGEICLVTKRIKNFGYLLEQLRESGYSEVYQVNEKGEIRLTD